MFRYGIQKLVSYIDWYLRKNYLKFEDEIRGMSESPLKQGIIAGQFPGVEYREAYLKWKQDLELWDAEYEMFTSFPKLDPTKSKKENCIMS